MLIQTMGLVPVDRRRPAPWVGAW